MLKCAICGRVYGTKQGLEYHNDVVHKSKMWPCPFCDKTFGRKAYVLQHTTSRVHQRHNSFQCLPCACGFAQASSLYPHAVNIHNSTLHISVNVNADVIKQECKACNARFNTVTEFWTHFKQDHVSEKSFMCPTCELEFDDQRMFGFHVQNHMIAWPEGGSFRASVYPCDMCTMEFTHNTHLADHLVEDHARSSKHTILCHKCATLSTSSQSYTFHTKNCLKEWEMKVGTEAQAYLNKQHKTDTDKPDPKTSAMNVEQFECVPCNRTFSSANVLVEHCQRVHDPSQTADDCPSTSSALEDKTPGFTCSECGMSFNQINKLQQHHKTHSVTVNHRCSICKIVFPKKLQLEAHMRTIHECDTPHICLQCGKRFATIRQLRIHLNTHNKKYTCQICSRNFAQKCELDRHRNVHTDERPYICAYCNKSFRQMGGLKKHVKLKHIFPPLRGQMLDMGMEDMDMMQPAVEPVEGDASEFLIQSSDFVVSDIPTFSSLETDILQK